MAFVSAVKEMHVVFLVKHVFQVLANVALRQLVRGKHQDLIVMLQITYVNARQL